MGIMLWSSKSLFFLIVLLIFLLYPLNLNWKRLEIFNSRPQTSRFHLSPATHALRPAGTRLYNFTLAEETLWPNGVQKKVFTINGLFPGPTIEVRSGDLLVVNVHNGLSEATSLHWHGIRHPPETQVQISPTMFRFLWSSTAHSGEYHSHYSTHRADGLFGALVVHPPVSLEEDGGHRQDELRSIRSTRFKRDAVARDSVLDQVMLVGDWYHRSGKEVLDWFQSLRSRGNEPVPDAVLNNGQQAFNCSKSIAKIICDPARGHTPTFALYPQHRNLVRFINTGSVADIHLSLDSHLLRVIEADGTDIQPVTVKELAIAPGQRYAVELVCIDRSMDRFWLRQRINYEDFKYPNVALDLESKSILTYGRSRTTEHPNSVAWSDIKPGEYLDALSLRPLDPSAAILPPADDVVMMYVTTMIRTSTGNRPFGYVNQTSWKPSSTDPILARADSAPSSKELIYSINPIPTNISSSLISSPSVVMDIVVNNLEDGPHPFHLHGHHFWPLYTYQAMIGPGSYRWDHPPTLPTTAPALRDTFVIPAKGHVIFRVKFDTPGLWLFHCHVLVHLQSGMGMIFDVMGDRIPLEDRINGASSCAAS
ncbi:hypothetical protein D9757_004454 [Collybiopsis confluens]|uniref:laccase n=1 Tax=Collybiopsis confluens TaxID=2823264 RepID=A0A8H5MEE5_9AGAR|nr:hypothetical protein D9757_004454 [Collybiopsis confluens]